MTLEQYKQFRRSIIIVLISTLTPVVLGIGYTLLRDHRLICEMAKYKVDKLEYHEGMAALLSMIEKKTIAIENLATANTKDIHENKKDIEELIKEYRILRDKTVEILIKVDPERTRGLMKYPFMDNEKEKQNEN